MGRVTPQPNLQNSCDYQDNEPCFSQKNKTKQNKTKQNKTKQKQKQKQKTADYSEYALHGWDESTESQKEVCGTPTCTGLRKKLIKGLSEHGNGDANNDITKNHHLQTELTGPLLDALRAEEKKNKNKIKQNKRKN